MKVQLQQRNYSDRSRVSTIGSGGYVVSKQHERGSCTDMLHQNCWAIANTGSEFAASGELAILHHTANSCAA
uniref:Uncharacterized protein n=1 Tax=Peronospora matthiolae TaxID=2874970 RepID=A0AAV1VGY4_9STRA